MATFHPFPRLPLELREQIWKDTVEPRTVDVRRVEDWHVTSDGVWGLTRTLSSTPVPATLQSCREARNLGLYERVFMPNNPREAGPHDAEQRYVWLNLNIDMVDIGTTYFSLYKHIAPAIKRLKFSRENGNDFFYHTENKELEQFVNVQEIHIDCADGFWMWYGATDEHCWPCAIENLLFIDAFDGRVARGLELETIGRETLMAWRVEATGKAFNTDDEFSD
ncbi:hypothetical protein J3E72DRAFT_406142 [Bipolaris maydis]|nr:hypothetical protein J3E72DRAFT_406142 [Bipolaris maydis]